MTRRSVIILALALSGCTFEEGRCPELDPSPLLRRQGRERHLERGECVFINTDGYSPLDAGGGWATTRIICGCEGDAGHYDSRTNQSGEEPPARPFR